MCGNSLGATRIGIIAIIAIIDEKANPSNILINACETQAQNLATPYYYTTFNQKFIYFYQIRYIF